VEKPARLVVSSPQTPDEIEALVSDALKNPTGLLTLVDEKGRRYVLPSARVSYVEIARPTRARSVSRIGG